MCMNYLIEKTQFTNEYMFNSEEVLQAKNKLFENFYNQNARTFISAMQLSMQEFELIFVNV